MEVKGTLCVDAHAYDGVGVDAFQSSCTAGAPPASFCLAKPKIASPILFEAYLLDL